MNFEQKQALISHLSNFVTENKRAAMAKVLAQRTRHITLVLEDLFQPHNASAVLRSAECFGIQDIHIIEKRNQFKATQGIAMGSAKWLDLHYYADTISAYESLRASGYLIAATTPHPNAVPLSEVPLNKKIALVFGTEHAGLTKTALEHADMFVTIPMYGFTQSFNVSVSTALCLYQLTENLKKSAISWHLSPEEKEAITLSWLRRTIRGASGIEKAFLMQNQGKSNIVQV